LRVRMKPGFLVAFARRNDKAAASVFVIGHLLPTNGQTDFVEPSLIWT